MPNCIIKDSSGIRAPDKSNCIIKPSSRAPDKPHFIIKLSSRSPDKPNKS